METLGVKIGIILQARISSQRLPGKVLQPLKESSESILSVIWRTFLESKLKVSFIIATSNETSDQPIVDFCKLNEISYYRGSLENVLERYVQSATKYDLGHIIRLTGDNPFINFGLIQVLIDKHLETDSDYTSSFESLPIGIGSEIFSMEALRESLLKGYLPHHFEHVNEYILENPTSFKFQNLDFPLFKQHSKLSFTVDTPADFIKFEHLYGQVAGHTQSLEKLVKLCTSYV